MMKKITYLLFLSILFTNVTLCQSVSFGQSKVQRIYDVHKRVSIEKNIPKLFEKLSEAGVDVACGVYFTDTHIQIELSEYELERISDVGITYKVLIEDVTKFYAERAARDMPQAQLELQREKQLSVANKSSSVKSTVIKNIGQHDDCSEITWNTPVNFTIPTTFGGCFTYAGVGAELDKMRQMYPNLISVKANASPSSQLTHEGRVVYVVKISDNPDTDELEPQSLSTGMTHSREVSSLMNQIFYMWYLLENYNSDPFIKNLVDNTEMYFIPVVNPDGLAWNQTIAPTGGGMQRKNLRPGICNPGGTASTNNTRGVDINRNFGYQYGLVGSTTTVCDNTYRGTAAFSEPETQIMRDFILAKNIKTALNHHAYSNLLPHPVNGRASTPTGRENEFAKFCHDMTQYNRYVYGPAPSILYAASGDASDWMTGGPADAQGNTGSGKNVLAVSPENGAASGEGNFWPSPLQITNIAKRAMRMNFINSYYSGKYAKLHDLTQSNISTLSSNLTYGIERLGHTPSNFTLTFTPVSSNIVSITNPVVQTGMTLLEQRNVTAALVLSPSILPNQKIEYKVTLSNGDYVLYEANYEKLYNPTVLFNNTDADVLTKWTSTGGAWVTSTSAYSGTTSITDASTVAYANSTNKSIAMTNAINLSGAQKILVQYFAKWDLERNFDLVQIQATTNNGTSWTTLCGNYTKPTSSTATNPHATKSANSNAQSANGGGGVLYDGDTRGKWAMEEIVIDATNNSAIFNATSVKFRFRLISDNSNATDLYNTTFDGFYFDDFKVIKQVSEPPVAVCKNATLSLDSTGSLTVLPSDVNDASTDDIGITTITVSPNSFNCTHANTTQSVTLTVTDADGQTSTCMASVTITVPVATSTSISPNTTTSGGTAFTLTVNGTNFVNGQSVVRWNGTNRPTTFVSATQLTASISAADILTSGTANVTVFNTCSSITTSAQVFTITSNCSVITNWNGSGWSNGLPASNRRVTFTGSYSGPAINACALEVYSPANVVFTSGNSTVDGAVTVQSGATLTFNNNVNLIQTTDVANSGNVIIKRNSNPLMRFDYIGWSSPVLNQGLLSYSPLTSINPTVRFYTFNSAANVYTSVGSPAINTATFDSGKGYLIRLPFDHPTSPTIWTGTFTGQPYNGPKSVTLANHISDATKRFNLIGNPYPSTISIPAFATANSANIEPSIYFWRKTNNALSPSYCSYNIVSGVYADNGEAYTENPNGVIQIGQGFLAQAKPGATEVVFANNQRIANNANQTFRSSSQSSTSTNTENNNFWLNMTGAPTEFSQTVIGYHTNATQGIDDYDSVYFNDGAIAFTSIVDGQNLVIQGRVGPFNPADVVPMRYKVANSGTYSIVIDHAEGIFSSGSQSIYVKDNLLNTYHNLNTGAYTFTSTAGTFADRFEVVYQTALSNDVVDFTSNNVTLYNQNNILNINSGNTTMDTVKVFDIRGRLIVEKKNIVSSQVQINVPPTNQVLLVEITSIEGINVVKKVLN